MAAVPAPDDTQRSLDLPPDLWEHILLHDLNSSSEYRQNPHLKQLSLVNRLFAQICQSRLFSSLSIRTCVTLRYSSDRSTPTSKLDWTAWERELQSVMKAERRLALVAEHAFLAAQPREFVVKGYECRRSYPPRPFQRPPERSALSRSVFDAFTHLREALHLHLPAFSNLRKLQISNYPVTTELLDAFDAHPSLTELSFNFCWLPESTSPLTSITSLSFHEIPGSHAGRQLLSSNYDPYKNIPDHYVRSAFNLTFPSHIESFDVTFGHNRSQILPVFEQLCATAPGEVFSRLERLVWRFDSKAAALPDGALIFQFLERTPALRKLSVYGYAPPLSPGPAGTLPLPTTHCPLLESLLCPLGWARVLTPGRPLTSLTLRPDTGTSFLARTPHSLSALLHPLTLSTAPTGITSLHLPPYPPIAPISLLHSFLSAHFPGVRDLGIAVAEGRVEWLKRERLATHDTPGLPWAEVPHDKVADEALVERLERDVREAVEAELRGAGGDLGSGSPPLPPVTDRVAAYLRDDALTKRPRQLLPWISSSSSSTLAPKATKVKLGAAALASMVKRPCNALQAPFRVTHRPLSSTTEQDHPSDAASQLAETPGPDTTSSASTAPSALLQPPTMSLLQAPHVNLYPLPPLVDLTVTANGVPAPQPVAYASPPTLVAPNSASTTDDESEYEREDAKPKDIEDFMHLLSLGVYTLPASIQTLTLHPHFRVSVPIKVAPLDQIRSWRQHTVLVLPPPPIQRPLAEPQAEFPPPSSSSSLSREVLKARHVQKQSAVERTALSQLARTYPELETLRIEHGWVRESVRYHKRSDGGGGWEKCAGYEGMNRKGY